MLICYFHSNYITVLCRDAIESDLCRILFDADRGTYVFSPVITTAP